jgi:hypothetical protein
MSNFVKFMAAIKGRTVIFYFPPILFCFGCIRDPGYTSRIRNTAGNKQLRKYNKPRQKQIQIHCSSLFNVSILDTALVLDLVDPEVLDGARSLQHLHQLGGATQSASESCTCTYFYRTVHCKQFFYIHIPKKTIRPSLNPKYQPHICNQKYTIKDDFSLKQ